MSLAKTRVFNKKAEIFKVGSPPTHVTIVVRGIVQVHMQGKIQRHEGIGESDFN